MKNSIDNEVINKSIKGTRKRKSKILDFFRKHKIIILIFIILLIIIVGLCTFLLINNSKDKKVLSINDEYYRKSDFMIYLYSVKTNYFGSDNLDDLTSDDYNAVVDEENNIKVSDYLKNNALNDLKTAAAIKILADKYDVTLDNKELKELNNEKKDFIKSLGGKKEYKKFLKKYNTNDKAFDTMRKTDKIYNKLIKNIYSKGKINDLTDKEIDTANKDYYSNYVKIKQVILTTIDLNTGKSLSSAIINQKQTLANTIVDLANNGTDFDELIKKYSEDAVDKEGPYETYFKNSELLEELRDSILGLAPGEVSTPVKTSYAYHIIQRLELDDKKLEEYYDDLREDKCIDDLKEILDDIKIVYYDAYKKINVK